jgi:hypothetical protein
MFAATPSVHGEASQYNYIQTTVEGKGTQRNQMVKHKMGGHLPMVDMNYILAEYIFYFFPPRQLYFAAYLSSSPHGGGQVATVKNCIDTLVEKKKKVTVVDTLPPDGVADQRDTHGVLLHCHNSPSMKDLGKQYVSISWPECALVSALMDMFKREDLFVDKGRGRGMGKGHVNGRARWGFSGPQPDGHTELHRKIDGTNVPICNARMFHLFEDEQQEFIKKIAEHATKWMRKEYGNGVMNDRLRNKLFSQVSHNIIVYLHLHVLFSHLAGG